MVPLSFRQYMMHQKAVVFGNAEIAKQILATNDVAFVKKLGRQVSGYIENVWNGMRQILVFEGLMAKYSQNPDLQNPAVIIDTNHSNSGKQPLEQIRIAKEIVMNRRLNADVGRLVKGLMIESYIEDGAQPVGGGCYGKSITDACLGWDKSQRLILDLAEML